MRTLLEFCSAARAIKMAYLHFSKYFSPTIEAYSSLAPWATIVCALNGFSANYTRFTETLFRHLLVNPHILLNP